MKKKLNIILGEIEKKGLFLLVSFLPFQTQWIFKQGSISGDESNYLSLSIYVIDLLIIILFFIKFFKNNLKNFFKKNSLLSFLYFLFIASSTVSIFYATNKLVAIEHTLWFILAGGLAFLVRIEKEKISLIFAFLLGLAVSLAIGIWQFLNQYAFANKWLGLAQHNPKNGGTFVVEIISNSGENLRWLRAYGTFDHPNIFGSMMVLGIFLILYIFWEKKFYQKYLHRVFLYIFLILFSVGAFFSLSRAAWLGILMAAGSFFCILFFKKQRQGLFFSLSFFSIVLAVFLILGIFYSKQVFVRSSMLGRLEQKSLSERQLSIFQGKQIIKNNLVFGVGAGNYLEELKKVQSLKEGWDYQPVHNVFLLIWAELGMAGIFIVIALVLNLFNLAFKNNLIFFVLLISQIPAMLFDHWLFSLHFGIILVGFLVGLVLNDSGNNNLENT
jgi:O-antigen ligase